MSRQDVTPAETIIDKPARRQEIDKAKVRGSLPPDSEPYWKSLGTGLNLGFRKLDTDGAGTWIARQHLKGTKYKFLSLGSIKTVTYGDAVETARKWGKETLDGIGLGKSKVKTVAELCDAYVKHARSVKGEDNAEQTAEIFHNRVKGTPLADINIKEITSANIRDWRDGLKRVLGDEPLSNNSKHRYWTPLRAALNYAADELNLVSDERAREWRRIEDLDEVNQRELYLSKEERDLLIMSAPAEYQPFMRALCLLPVRPGALAQCLVEDLEIKVKGSECLRVKADYEGKIKKKRDVPLTPDTLRFLKEQAKGKFPKQLLFADLAGNQWIADTWKKGFHKGRASANLDPETCAYTLRHSLITDMVKGGIDIFTVAKIAGTSVKQIENHYGKYRNDMTREQWAAIAL